MIQSGAAAAAQTPADLAGAPPLESTEPQQLSLVQLSLLALALGIVTGLGAVLFRDLIGLLHNLMFAGHWAVRYDANVFTAPSRWGPWVILVPVVGAVGVTFLVSNFAPEAKGHGVPEVMDAIYLQGRQDPAGGGAGEVAGLGDRHRQRRLRRPRRSDHPDRLGSRLDARTDRAHARRDSGSPWSPPAPAPGSRRRSIPPSAG